MSHSWDIVQNIADLGPGIAPSFVLAGGGGSKSGSKSGSVANLTDAARPSTAAPPPPPSQPPPPPPPPFSAELPPTPNVQIEVGRFTNVFVWRI